MKQLRLTIVALLFFAHYAYSQCTTTNATSCQCESTGSTNCDLLPDIIVARPPLTVSGNNGNIEYSQSGNGANDGRLRVSVSSPNIGHGPLEVRALQKWVCGTDTLTSYPANGICPNNGQLAKQLLQQRVYHKNGNTMSYTDRDAGTMTYHPTHSHMHVDDWGIYSLRSNNGDPNPLNWPVIGNGAKLAFCLMDYGSCSTYNGHCVDANGNTLLNSNFPNYGLGGGAYNCSPSIQGISSGWTDIYYQYLDGMWINLPAGLCNGQYWIVVQLDPYNYFQEENENNNVLAVPWTLTLQNGTVPTVSAASATTFCQGGSVTLTASTASDYLWSNGATTQSINVSAAGNYSVTVNNTSSCPSTSTATTVTVNPMTVSASSNQTSICQGQSVNLTSTAAGGGTQNQTLQFANSAAISIPDNNTTGITSNVNVSGVNPSTINSNSIVSVKINITHTYDADLIVSLISPSGSVIKLSNRRGGGGDNFVNTFFMTSATTAIASGSAPFTGNYRPDEAFSLLSGNVNGTWTLKVQDVDASDLGTLNNWTLSINTQVPTSINYAWSSNPSGYSSVNQNNTVSPSQTTTYTVVATESGTGCTGSQSVTVNVNAIPNLTVNTPAAYCDGGSATLTANGATTYSWSPSAGLSATSGASVIANPSSTTTYSITGSNNGCDAATSVTVNVNPNPVASATSTNVSCNGANNGTATASASSGTSPYGYSWSPSGGNASTASGLAPGTYTCTVTDANGCAASASRTISQPSAIQTSTSVTDVPCNGTSGAIDLSVSGGTPNYFYSWSNGATTEDLSGLSAGTYTCTISDSKGCVSSVTATVNSMGSGPAIPQFAAGESLVCRSQSNVIYAVSNVPGLTYNWTAPPTVTIVNGQGTSSIEVSFSSTVVNGNISVSASNQCGTSNTAAFSYAVVTAKPVQPTAINGSLTACAGSNNQIFSTPPVANTIIYSWTVPANATIVSGQGTNTITVNFSGTWTTGYLIVNASNCVGTSANRTVTLYSKPSTPQPIVGTTNGVCINTNGLSFSIPAVTAATGYTWSVPAGVTIASGQGTNNITVNTDATFTSGVLSVTADNVCGSSNPRAVNIYSKPVTPGVITGTVNNMCAGSTNVPYSIAAVAGATNYQWTAPANATIVSGQGSTSVLVDYGANFTTGTLSVSAGNGCGFGPLRASTVRSIPTQPGAMSGNAYNNCNASNQIFSVATVANASNYVWSVPAGVSIVSGQGTNTITVSFNPGFVSGSLCVTANNACGGSTARCLGVYAKTSVPGAISGPSTACANQQNVSYSVSPVAGASIYNWSVPSGATIVNGQGSTSVLVNFGAAGGNVMVNAGNACGNTGNSVKGVSINCRLNALPTIDKLSVYPNPASNILNIEFNISELKGEKAHLEVTDVAGRTMFSENMSVHQEENDHSVDVQSLAPGVYTLKLSYDDKFNFVKFIVE